MHLHILEFVSDMTGRTDERSGKLNSNRKCLIKSQNKSWSGWPVATELGQQVVTVMPLQSWQRLSDVTLRANSKVGLCLSF